ncbi:MAG TPA: uridine kinase [Terriglobales bacterium]|nr:uridine kinase [Terriglobales bacterium]
MRKRVELDSKLKGESLVRKSLLKSQAEISPLRLIPDLNVVKIGGHGIIDYGRDVVMPLVEEIGALSKEHKILVVTGGGARVRHIMSIGIDLGMPTGVLAEMSAKISEQNAIMMTLLLSKWGGSRLHTSDLLDLPTMFSLGLLPVIHGTPPYGLYEYSPEVGLIPPHRTDTGALLIAQLLGAKSCILVKNVDGLYEQDPRLNPEAPLIRDITAEDLLNREMEDMVLEPKAVELLQNPSAIQEIKIINGHKPGQLSEAINGGEVGTVIHR